ncbi:hypothetical protein Rsub_12324 [Raphidocelis subcapitata]|uniref:Single-stranded DNA-binding protein n=1 Tax=Raphidocelis subcapitata TaxID=307507 RepID=A0A2V0PHV3_9CHLO|nr:hypothetical protein Rsub_12324 [Raphidocelis subcapitata]|eukprot:GBF99391.1 hypothetical protein Rsub_12324 [Raphidocelis subcapitata]
MMAGLRRLVGGGAPAALAPVRLALRMRGAAPPPALRPTAVARAYATEGGEGGVYDATFDPDCRNAVVITGNSGGTPELRSFPSGAVTSLNLAVPMGKDKTSWFRVDVFSPLAEEVAHKVTRGTKVVVHGYLKQDEWTDKATGAKRSAVKVVARSVGVIPRYDGPGMGAAADAPDMAPQQPAAPQQQMQAPVGAQPYAQQPAAAAGGWAPAPPAVPANETEVQWLSVIQDPGAWWDNRTNKRNPRAPDFKQRDGDAALWIQSNNTPDWVPGNLPPPRM